MAEKRRLFGEIEKTFKKIDEGVEEFETIMSKMQDANSDNQRDKYQDDLKKEIKKLQRLRDNVKNWQNNPDIKDKDKLIQYRKTIEQRMEQFKDIERENKTKPHSKVGLCAEEKMDPKEKEKMETTEWVQSMISDLNMEVDRTETALESLNQTDTATKKGRKGKEDKKGGDTVKKAEDLRKHHERMQFHIQRLELCMRLVNNETLESRQVAETLKDQVEMYVASLDPDYDGENGPSDTLDPESAYEELDLGSYATTLGGVVHVSSIDHDPHSEHDNGGYHENGSVHEEDHVKSRHGSAEAAPLSPVIKKTTVAQKVSRQLSTDTSSVGPPRDQEKNVSPAPAIAPPTPVLPYNSVAASGLRSTPPVSNTAGISPKSQSSKPPALSTVAPPANLEPPVPSPVLTAPREQLPKPAETSPQKVQPEDTAPAPDLKLSQAELTMKTLTQPFANIEITSSNNTAGHVDALLSNTELQPTPPHLTSADLAMHNNVMHHTGLHHNETLRHMLQKSQNNLKPRSGEPQTALIPPWLGASPLGRAPHSIDLDAQQHAVDMVMVRCPPPFDSEKPRSYLPKMPMTTSACYPQSSPPASDTVEYYLRLTPESLFFTFYYMEGSRAQLLAAKALKRLSWRFHTKYLMWFQRHDEPKAITDDYEQGTYLYFDYEKWAQRKKESFMFEYKYLEDKDFD